MVHAFNLELARERDAQLRGQTTEDASGGPTLFEPGRPDEHALQRERVRWSLLRPGEPRAPGARR